MLTVNEGESCVCLLGLYYNVFKYTLRAATQHSHLCLGMLTIGHSCCNWVEKPTF